MSMYKKLGLRQWPATLKLTQQRTRLQIGLESDLSSPCLVCMNDSTS